MEDDDVCILFGNLLDNAIEAAKYSDEKVIRLKLQRQEAYASIFVTNSIKKSVLKTNNTLESTKQNKEQHGYGIKNIMLVVSRYKGIIDFFEKNDEFCCDILLLD